MSRIKYTVKGLYRVAKNGRGIEQVRIHGYKKVLGWIMNCEIGLHYLNAY